MMIIPGKEATVPHPQPISSVLVEWSKSLLDELTCALNSLQMPSLQHFCFLRGMWLIWVYSSIFFATKSTTIGPEQEVNTKRSLLTSLKLRFKAECLEIIESSKPVPVQACQVFQSNNRCLGAIWIKVVNGRWRQFFFLPSWSPGNCSSKMECKSDDTVL